MNKFLHLIFLFIFGFGSPANAQTYGNEWINYNQKYYQFSITQTGIYRIDYSQLVAASIPVGTFTPRNIQLFGREKEVPIFIVDGNDNSLDSGDYFLFYAEKNDGWLDSNLYMNPEKIGNPAYSLYNDTIHYFFTWNNLQNNARFTEETDDNFSAYSPTPFVLWQQTVDFHNSYNEGPSVGSLSTSFFNDLEGFSSNPSTGPLSFAMNLPTPFVFTGANAPLVDLQINSFGSNNAPVLPGSPNHHVQFTLNPNNLVLLDSLYNGIRGIQFKTTLNSSQLGSNTTTINWNIINDLGVAADNQGLSYLSLTYPRQPNLGTVDQYSFSVLNNINQNKSLLNLTWNTTTPLLFSLGDVPRKLKAIGTGSGIIQALLPNSNSGNPQKIVYANEDLVRTVSNLVPVNGTGNFKNYAAITPDSALLMVYHSKLEIGAQAYKNYRSSLAGGNHQVIDANANDLFLQFGGGIPKHINGIRRFAHYMYDLSVQKPAGLILLGKGIREANVITNTTSGAGTRNNAAIYAQSLIPSFGQPSSDVAITASLLPNNWKPLIPTGRVSVNTNAELENYLSKVIAYEIEQDSTSVYSSTTKDWQKQVIHFGGGTTAFEQTLFRAYLEGMESKIEDSKFAGNVTRVYKNNSDPLDPATFSEISDRLRSGISLMNFFGHANSQTSGFEINIDEPTNWDNKGKYPIVIANTCFNGNIFYHEDLGTSTSEKFLRANESGAIAFLSAVYLGFASTLSTYTSGLYEQFSSSGYGLSLGKQIQNNIDSMNYLSQQDGGTLTEATALQMTLNGDPMIKLNWHTKPEIELLSQNVTFGPSQIDLTVDSIELRIKLVNLGQSITDTFLVEIKRNFPQSNIDSIYQIQVPELQYEHEFIFKMPLQPNVSIGINQFTVSADIPSFQDEVYDEFVNNRVVKNLFINIDGIEPVAPTRFAVVPSDSVVLKASTIDPLADINTYLFELDTTDLFNSPFKRIQNVLSVGGVKEAFPANWLSSSSGAAAPFLATDSTVYFWRVALSEPTLVWKESSFQYINDKSGWGQDHFFQFKDNNFTQIDYNRGDRKLYFSAADTTFLDCFVYGTNVTTGQNQWLLNNQQQDYDMCGLTPSIHVAVIDPITYNSWGTRWISATGDTTNPNNGFGNVNDLGQCRNRVEKYFIFRQNSASQLAAFQNMVLNEVPNGHYLLIYTPRSGALYNSWTALDSLGMYSTFAALGSDSINAGRTNTPMAFFTQKGDPTSVIELFGQLPNDPVLLTAPLIGSNAIGQQTSTLIGPAAKWNNFYWKLDSEESTSGDSSLFQIDGYDANQNFQYTLSLPLQRNDSIINLENDLMAQNSPYLKIRGILTDSTTLTPPQLDRWHVLYDPMPEAAIDGTNGYLWSAAQDTVSEGATISFAIDVRNISDRPMDSLLIYYYIEDENNVKHYLNYPRQDSLRVNQTLRDTFTFSTNGYAGNNIFWMEVNPYSGPLGTLDQPEQFHFNNIIQIPFSVRGDDKNPILDVTFDGRHILNGDIVNPYSEILITLKDDNPLLIMNEIADTALFGIYLTNPDGIQTRIPFEANGQPVMNWIPADAQNLRFKIMYPGAFEQDGKYTLLVQGSDKSGNISGDLEYRIRFEVVRESSITRLMNYPNPFSTSTKFVFTLTGSEVPDDLMIQIMTVTGKVIREIDETEFGPMFIGRNISEFSWDGTDDYGDQLANGVYLYRVRMKLNGESMKIRTSGADTYFTKEFGKMYLMR